MNYHIQLHEGRLLWQNDLGSRVCPTAPWNKDKTEFVELESPTLHLLLEAASTDPNLPSARYGAAPKDLAKNIALELQNLLPQLARLPKLTNYDGPTTISLPAELASRLALPDAPIAVENFIQQYV